MHPDEPVAHSPNNSGAWHSLREHLERVADLAHQNAAKFGAADLGYLAGLWHDLGKYDPAFQAYLRAAHAATVKGQTLPHKGPPHAIHGARLAATACPPILPAILGHHAGLPPAGSLRARLADRAANEPAERAATADLGSLRAPSSARALAGNVPTERLAFELFGRMLFSALVDADYLDTEAHFEPGRARLRVRGQPLAGLPAALDAFLERLALGARPSAVNEVRSEVLQACIAAASAPRGVFRLCVPTGGGKTLSGLAFALRHASIHGLDRVVIAVPYTSIIEQTAAAYRGVFGDEAVLEHHSAAFDDREDEAFPTLAWQRRLAIENWDVPLVVTTTVQLFESLFADRPSRCRKLHNLARSVIVLDEVQALPIGLLPPIVDALNELCQRYGATVVLCTATQPALEGTTPYLRGFSRVEDIVQPAASCGHFARLRRVEYVLPPDPWSWEDVAGRMRNRDQALVVLNSRRDALRVLDELAGDDGVLHLSTLLCGRHRRQVLAEVRRRLGAGEACRLVSTQVVEAGVDLDFPEVLRAVGPLDRIVQAAGRCNREGRLERGLVTIFRPKEGRAPAGAYATETTTAERMLREPDLDLHDPKVFDRYYSSLYQALDPQRQAAEITAARTALDYPEVARLFRLIPDDTVPVVVEFDDAARALVSRARRYGLRPGDHRRLQPYLVSLRRREIEQAAGLAPELAPGLRVWAGGYDALRGITGVETDPADLVW